MPQTLYNFNTPSNYTLNNTEITAGLGRLKLIPNPGQVFTQAFTTDAGFTYDAAKAEFTGILVRQKDQRPFQSKVGATYTSSKDLSWASTGSLTATDIGAPVLNAGKLECHGGGNNAVRYENADIGSVGDVGAIKVKYTPNYSGAPSGNVQILQLVNPSNNNGLMTLFHAATGSTLRLTAYTSAGTVKYSAIAFGGAWSPVAGTEYELELNWDTIAGQVRLFVNGVLQGSMAVSSYARGSGTSRLYVGAGTSYPSADAAFNDVILFSAVQHTANYTAGYTLPEFSYAASTVILPAFSYTGEGTVLTVDNGSITEVGAPRFIIAGKYWNGSIFAASNGTYAESSSFATIVANLENFNAEGATAITVSLVFNDSNSLSSVDNFSVEVTGEITAPSGSIITNSIFISNLLTGFDADYEVPTGAYLGFFALIGTNAKKYFNGTNWVESDGFSQAQTNSKEEFAESIELLIANNVQVQLGIYMERGDDNLTPEIDWASYEHNFGALDPNAALRCNTYMYLTNLEGAPLEGITVNVKLIRESTQYAETSDHIVLGSLSKESDDEGFVNFALIRSSEFEVAVGEVMKYVITFTIDDESSVDNNGLDANLLPLPITFTVPDLESVNITDQIQAA